MLKDILIIIIIPRLFQFLIFELLQETVQFLITVKTVFYVYICDLKEYKIS